jgi:hypothetical protein
MGRSQTWFICAHICLHKCQNREPLGANMYSDLTLRHNADIHTDTIRAQGTCSRLPCCAQSPRRTAHSTPAHLQAACTCSTHDARTSASQVAGSRLMIVGRLPDAGPSVYHPHASVCVCAHTYVYTQTHTHTHTHKHTNAHTLTQILTLTEALTSTARS